MKLIYKIQQLQIEFLTRNTTGNVKTKNNSELRNSYCVGELVEIY